MTRYLTVVVLLGAMLSLASACKKDKNDNDDDVIDFNPLTTGSSWTYQSNTGMSYTLTVTNRDTVALARTYKVLSNSFGPNAYRAKSGSDYFQFAAVPVVAPDGIEQLYLKDDQNVSAFWQNNQLLNVPGVPVPILATLKYTIQEKGITRIVNSKTFNDVIHVRLDVSALGIGALGGGDFYYANRIGLIENSIMITYGGATVVNTTDILTAYTIQ